MAVPRLKLHAGGPEVSRLAWGAMRVPAGPDASAKDLAATIEACVDLGITTFDLADIYGDHAVEAAFGAALREWAGARDAIQLVSKCGIVPVGRARPDAWVKHYDTTPGHIARSAEASLRALGVERLDLYLLHRPDPLMDADATARALDTLVRAGKVAHVGVSNHGPAQVDLLQSRLDLPLVTNQVEFSLKANGALDDGTLDQAQRLSAAPMVWSPLGGGAIGKDARLSAALDDAARRSSLAEPSAAALAWVLRHPSHPVPVLGTGRVERLRALVKACDAPMDRQTWFALLEAARGRAVA